MADSCKYHPTGLQKWYYFAKKKSVISDFQEILWAAKESCCGHATLLVSGSKNSTGVCKINYEDIYLRVSKVISVEWKEVYKRKIAKKVITRLPNFLNIIPTGAEKWSYFTTKAYLSISRPFVIVP